MTTLSLRRLWSIYKRTAIAQGTGASKRDNFEWAAGYTKRIGIYYVDYQTQARILKRSGFWHRDLAAAFNAAHGDRTA